MTYNEEFIGFRKFQENAQHLATFLQISIIFSTFWTLPRNSDTHSSTSSIQMAKFATKMNVLKIRKKGKLFWRFFSRGASMKSEKAGRIFAYILRSYRCKSMHCRGVPTARGSFLQKKGRQNQQVFDEKLLNCCDWSGAKECASWGSRKMLKT